MLVYIERHEATVFSLSLWERAGVRGVQFLGQSRRSFDLQNHCMTDLSSRLLLRDQSSLVTAQNSPTPSPPTLLPEGAGRFFMPSASKFSSPTAPLRSSPDPHCVAAVRCSPGRHQRMPGHRMRVDAGRSPMAFESIAPAPVLLTDGDD
jgi:hypothetical protein